MDLIPAKIPWPIKKIFSGYTWDIPTSGKTLYLTFDDGPTPKVTEWVLGTLKDFNAYATFFCIGKNIDKHPDIFARIVESGHTIGNHTYNHVKGWKTDNKHYLEEARKTQYAIESRLENTVQSSKLFRPPYGRITFGQGKKLMSLGYKIIMWDVLAFDWDNARSNEKCLKYVISNAHSGSIVVFHDSNKASQRMRYALPKVLEHFSEKGYDFKGIPG
ncbi:MAG TPA: polysaccharide deacetylase family protein [Aquaticitalea sp.]|nr:polysaccharide deacetylase family protein [Aquaticitalea sp.]